SDITELKSRIESSLEDARTELSPADRVIVSDLWQELQAQA
ncbi:YfcL family protein, partial [Vibrio parahaemolyticus]|nr:YfcL family protein [Vibrio parahaemolyticus]